MPHGYTQHGKAHNAWQSRAASACVTSQQPEIWQPLASSSPHLGIRYTVDPSTVASGVQQSGVSGHVGGVPKQLEWQATPQLTRPMVHPAPTVMPPQSATVLPELITPDLDFDSDSETGAGQGTPVRASYGTGSYRQGCYAGGQTHSSEVQSIKHCSVKYATDHRLSSTTRPTEQAECTVYNWDEAAECTHRRGHRPLSDLLNNVQ
ncbi:hypothetical protein Vafri_13016 [Volvox africanus]|nr:hypothetical protein Vafri_13016 [Volvox africanus]